MFFGGQRSYAGIKFKIFDRLLKIASDQFFILVKVMINLLIHSIYTRPKKKRRI